MEDKEYDKLAELEDHMWWFRSLHSKLLRILKRKLANPGLILDAGCGTGGFLVRLQHALPDIQPIGADLSVRVLTYARDKSSVSVVASSVNDLPFRDTAAWQAKLFGA